MTKADLVDVIADGADLSKTKAEEVLNLALDVIRASVARDNTMQWWALEAFLWVRAQPAWGVTLKPVRRSRSQHQKGQIFCWQVVWRRV